MFMDSGGNSLSLVWTASHTLKKCHMLVEPPISEESFVCEVVEKKASLACSTSPGTRLDMSTHIMPSLQTNEGDECWATGVATGVGVSHSEQVHTVYRNVRSNRMVFTIPNQSSIPTVFFSFVFSKDDLGANQFDRSSDQRLISKPGCRM